MTVWFDASPTGVTVAAVVLAGVVLVVVALVRVTLFGVALFGVALFGVALFGVRVVTDDPPERPTSETAAPSPTTEAVLFASTCIGAAEPTSFARAPLA